MKKLFFGVLVLGMLLPGKTVAQSFQKGQMDLNLGLGLGDQFLGTGYQMTLPPLSASFDYGINDIISIGGVLGYAGSKYSFSSTEWCSNNPGNQYLWSNYTDTYKWNYFIIGARGAYHFAKLIKIDKLDVYAGLMLGDAVASSSYSTTSLCPDHVRATISTSGGFVYSAFGGARYRFNGKAGVFAELGFGLTILNIGFNYKF